MKVSAACVSCAHGRAVRWCSLPMGARQAFASTRLKFHKTANVLNKVALAVQVNMKVDLREIYAAPTRAAAEAAIDVFADKYNAKHDKAVACLTKDREALLAFFDFPAEHWGHLRTSNPIESVFATVRHRTVRTKGALSAKTAKLMVFKLVNAAAKTWRRLNGENQLPKVVQGVNSKMASRLSKCRLTTPPDRSHHPISRIAPATINLSRRPLRSVSSAKSPSLVLPLLLNCHALRVSTYGNVSSAHLVLSS
jgi:hypothetical protein